MQRFNRCRRGIKRAILAAAVGISALPAVAGATSTELTMPSVTLPVSVATHGDGSYSLTHTSCSYYNDDPSSTATSVATRSSGDAAVGSISKINSGYQLQPCYNTEVAGSDNAFFVYEVGAAPNYLGKIAAYRNGQRLWEYPLKAASTCTNQRPKVVSMALGENGRLYVLQDWPYWSSPCPARGSLIAIEPGSGGRYFEVAVPGSGFSSLDPQTKWVHPYDGGVAVRGDNSVYYFDEDGTALTSQTFSPSLAGGASVRQMLVVPATGLTYLTTGYYSGSGDVIKLYYKDVGSSTITEVTLPSGKTTTEMYATPSGGIVVAWRVPSTGDFGFTYYDNTGSQVYSQSLSTESGAAVSGTSPGNGNVVVDADGNVIVRRVVDNNVANYDRNVIVDSFSPSGTATRLFTTASYGTSSTDRFNRSGALFESLTGDALYLVACHTIGGSATTCTSGARLFKISRSGGFDMSRTRAYAEASSHFNYVALGDSFSSGEGNPEFMAPSDTNGCHRSPVAWPHAVASGVSFNFRAFVACSGATTAEMIAGKNGEPSQLDALDDSTAVVTVTAGGNDVDFPALAHECIFDTCSDLSEQYELTLDAIEEDLAGQLADFYGEIRDEAENAAVYVVGYPEIAPGPGVSCTALSNSERSAMSYIRERLNEEIAEAVEAEDEEFIFIDPAAPDSPFEDHQYCDTVSYFNGIDPFNTEYTFHPNYNGQVAYAQVVATGISG